MQIPRRIPWGFDPDKSSLEVLSTAAGRVLWAVLRFGHIVDQHFSGNVLRWARSLEEDPPRDVVDFVRRAHYFDLHGYGVSYSGNMPFDYDPEWWGELLEAWRGNLKIEHVVAEAAA